MKHPITRIVASIVLAAIVLFSLYNLFSLISSDIQAVQDVNYAKAYISTIFIIGGAVGLLLLNTDLK